MSSDAKLHISAIKQDFLIAALMLSIRQRARPSIRSAHDPVRLLRQEY